MRILLFSDDKSYTKKRKDSIGRKHIDLELYDNYQDHGYTILSYPTTIFHIANDPLYYTHIGYIDDVYEIVHRYQKYEKRLEKKLSSDK